MRRKMISAVASAALTVLATLPVAAAAQGENRETAAAVASVSTPRLPDGTPDLSGVWTGSGLQLTTTKDNQGRIVVGIAQGDTVVALGAGFREGTLVNLERDNGLQLRSDRNRPHYKPEHWARVQWYDLNGNTEDPEFLCFPAGVPRMGPPSKIVQTPTELIFLYEHHNTFRVIYMDGRPHPPEDQWEGRWYGHSVARWEGETLVIDSVDFTDASWLGWPGWIHSYNMRVEERMRREGDTLRWEATVYDDMLLKPWTTNPVVRRLDPNPKAELPEDLPCSERDAPHMVTKERG